jgi:hypothetical protein
MKAKTAAKPKTAASALRMVGHGAKFAHTKWTKRLSP